MFNWASVDRTVVGWVETICVVLIWVVDDRLVFVLLLADCVPSISKKCEISVQ